MLCNSLLPSPVKSFGVFFSVCIEFHFINKLSRAEQNINKEGNSVQRGKKNSSSFREVRNIHVAHFISVSVKIK